MFTPRVPPRTRRAASSRSLALLVAVASVAASRESWANPQFAARYLSFDSGIQPAAVAIADLDGDGKSGREREPWIMLDPRAKRVTGSGGCNRISGGYGAGRDTLRFGRLVATRMACPSLDTETAFLRALDATRRYRTMGRILDLFDGAGQLLVRLEERKLR